MTTITTDILIIGAGAAGLMCAASAGKRGRRVLLVDHSKKLAEKIRISGGGRCNFTNMDIQPKNYLSENPHFCKSALKRYTNWDFISLISEYSIAYHERDHGQLFCDNSAQDIIAMLDSECQKANVTRKMEVTIQSIEKTDGGYHIASSIGQIEAESVVIATGGLPIPKIGATAFGLQIAEQFGMAIIPPRAALVPLTFDAETRAQLSGFQGIALDAVVSCKKQSFREAILFTHKGVSGPAILQISSYWESGDSITINLAPDHDIFAHLKAAKESNAKQEAQTALSAYLPKRLAQRLCELTDCTGKLAELPNKKLQTLGDAVNRWSLKPSGSEGYKTAEVMRGGVDTDGLSSKTFESKTVQGLYFIGEVVDVTGHLGGYNFQWAWASGYCAGEYV